MTELSNRVPMARLRDTDEFRSLTPKQQLFVETYIAGGVATGHYDPIGSTLTAYACKSRESARVLSHTLMHTLRIVELLSLHFAREPIEDFLLTLNQAIRNKKLTVAQVRALELKAAVMGFKTRLPGADNRNLPLDTIPEDVAARDKEERKRHRKARSKPGPKPALDVPETDIDRDMHRF